MRQSPLEMNLSERKSDLVRACFIETADMDYVTARWTYHNGVFHNFYWLSAQAVEKYLKAILLYNDVSTKKYRHNLKHLVAAVKAINPELMSFEITMPDSTGMGKEVWHEKSASLFIEHLNKYGSTANRYGLAGTYINGPVIHALDAVCARLRAFMRRNNFLTSDLFCLSQNNVIEFERINNDCDWMIDGELLLERLYVGKYRVSEGKDLQRAFRNMNFAFFHDRSESESTFGGIHISGSPLLTHLVRLKNIDPRYENQKTIDELRAWVNDKLQLDRNVREVLSTCGLR